MAAAIGNMISDKQVSAIPAFLHFPILFALSKNARIRLVGKAHRILLLFSRSIFENKIRLSKKHPDMPLSNSIILSNPKKCFAFLSCRYVRIVATMNNKENTLNGMALSGNSLN